LMKSREIIIIGGGLMALTIALELQQRGRSVTILSHHAAAAAGHAAAGMLAPQAEGLPPGAMLDLCLRSRSAYPQWVAQIEAITHQSVGYWPCGILAPSYDHPTTADRQTTADWQDAADLATIQPGLGPTVQGGRWFPEDAQVDNRALMQALLVAVQTVGVEICEGVEVQAIATDPHQVTHLETRTGPWQAAHYILATGAWSQAIVPVPVQPRKGQMLALRIAVGASGHSPLLQCVLFGTEIYIVPRQDGRVIVGATSENVGFAPGNTAIGVQHLLNAATRLFPALATCELLETWWGYRPTTPDQLPILGASQWDNLTLATGHYRNGVLLAPITGQLIAEWVIDRRADRLLGEFSGQRFASPQLTNKSPDND
jgi:glycine oxidase ThiO